MAKHLVGVRYLNEESVDKTIWSILSPSLGNGAQVLHQEDHEDAKTIYLLVETSPNSPIDALKDIGKFKEEIEPPSGFFASKSKVRVAVKELNHDLLK